MVFHTWEFPRCGLLLQSTLSPPALHPTIFFPTFGFVCEFWVCFEHSTHTPRCSTPTRRFFVAEIRVCLRVLGLFRTFHAHTTMLNTHPTIFCPSFGFVCDIWVYFEHSTHTPRCSTPTLLFFPPSFGFVSNIPRTHLDFISAKLEQYKNGGFHSKLEFIKCVSFYVSYQPDL